MRRREFIALLGGAAAAWPFVAGAQQQAMPVIGFLHYGSLATSQLLTAGFLQGLREAGLVEGNNATIEYRWAEGNYARFPALAADLVRCRVTVIAALSMPAALAAKAATSTIPITFGVADDPVRTGLVASLNRPGGSVTGVTTIADELGAKRLGFLRDLVPEAAVIAIVVNRTNPNAEATIRDAQAAATTIAKQIQIINASSEGDIDQAFANIIQQRVSALLVGNDPFYLSRRQQIVALAARHSLPAIYSARDYVTAGGLISYGSSIVELYRQVGVYTGRLVNGEKPADLPVLQPTEYELVINLKTAKTLGITVPRTLLAVADEVIE
jgi:putative tryptophan/tyrosine transport system substrate-binding protein